MQASFLAMCSVVDLRFSYPFQPSAVLYTREMSLHCQFIKLVLKEPTFKRSLNLDHITSAFPFLVCIQSMLLPLLVWACALAGNRTPFHLILLLVLRLPIMSLPCC